MQDDQDWDELPLPPEPDSFDSNGGNDLPADYTDPAPATVNTAGVQTLPRPRTSAPADSSAMYTQSGMALFAKETIRRVLASLHGQSVEQANAMLDRFRKDSHVLDMLDDEHRLVVSELVHMLTFSYGQVIGDDVDLNYLPLAGTYSSDVQTELEYLRQLASCGAVSHVRPMMEWQTLLERAQRAKVYRLVSEYHASLREGRSGDVLMEHYGKVRETPPTVTGQVETREKPALSIAELEDAYLKAMAGQTRARISLGYRMLDIALTNEGDMLGTIAPGEGFLIAGPTGTGKTSFIYGAIRGAAIDCMALFGRGARVALLHTEEESIDKARGAQMLSGLRFERLANNVDMVNVGSSRIKVVYYCFDAIIRAEDMVLQYGGKITDYLPYLIFLDYVGSLEESGEPNETEKTRMSAELILRGIQAWNVEEMAKFGGEGCLTYEEYAKRPLPKGMELHRVATVTMAQLVKQSDEELLFRPGPCQCRIESEDPEAYLEEVNRWSPTPVGDVAAATPDILRTALRNKKTYCKEEERLCPPIDRRVNPSNFVLADDKGAPEWNLREGDLKLLTKNAIRGSGALANNATCIILLHRSRPYNNPEAPGLGEDGRKHLTDTRARLILDKTRNGSKWSWIPMSFDLDGEGYKAQYYDALAERAMALQKFVCDLDAFEESGDPILPVREFRSPLAAVSY